MRIHSLIRPLAAALLTTSALALAACGEGSGTGGTESAADREKKERDAQLAFAQCMREHGIDMPDPQPGERGIRLTNPKGTSPAKMEEADKACRKHLEGLRGPELTDEQQKEFQEAALNHARCMREHGIDFPDPTFGENGQATIRIQRGKGRGGGIDPDDPKFKEAQKACESELPQLRGGDGPSTSEGSE
jgi:hypothetical protein